jgi:hypothetical protein
LESEKVSAQVLDMTNWVYGNEHNSSSFRSFARHMKKREKFSALVSSSPIRERAGPRLKLRLPKRLQPVRHN